MASSLQDIHAALAAKFGDAIAPFAKPEAGDAWIEVDPGSILRVAEFLKSDPAMLFDYYVSNSGVDYPPDHIVIVHHLFSYTHDHSATIKVRLDRAKPETDTLMHLWPAADWHERETFDLLGVIFKGHPELKRILLPDDWVGYPLRKDYKQPDEYHGVTNW